MVNHPHKKKQKNNKIEFVLIMGVKHTHSSTSSDFTNTIKDKIALQRDRIKLT